MDIQSIFSIDISNHISTQRYQAAEVLVKENQELKYLLYLTSGRAKCCITQENGKISIVDLVTAPCFLGDLELVGVQKSASGVIAITDCICQKIDLQDCRELILQDVKFLQFLCQTLGKKAIRNATYISMIQTYPLRNRLITFLLQMQNNGIYTGSLTEAADYLGVSYRHLLYVMAQLVDEGLLKKINGMYQLSNMKRLMEEKIL